jgi:LmbE family N-acetylglucosaminyl deacetylase
VKRKPISEHDPVAISDIRREEARKSAELIGADYRCLEFRDLAIFNDDDSRRRVTEALRQIRPEIIMTAPPSDYIADHEMTSLLVRDACFAAPCPNFMTRQWEPAAPLEKIPHLYFVDPLEGVDREGRAAPVDFHVDISRVFANKRASLACHASQREWLLRQHGMDEYLAEQAKWASKRGGEIGVAYAEAFRQYRGHPYPQRNLLLELVRQDGRGKPAEAGAAFISSHSR